MRISTMFKCGVNSWILVVFAAQLGFPLISADGTNLALMGNAQQSSTFYVTDPSSIAAKAIDGVKTGDFNEGGCTHTGLGDTKPNLNLTFATPLTIKRIILYNRLDGHSAFLSRLQGFILRCFSGDDKVLFTFIDPDPVAQPVYTVKLGKPVSGVAKVNVEATSMEANGFKVLTICELEVFGGKNLALRGNTKQSSTYVEDAVSTVSSNAIDEDKSGDFTKGGCSCTHPEDPKPNLNLTFVDPVTIKTIILYNRLDGNSDALLPRLQGFILRGFSRDNRVLFTITDTEPIAQRVYTVHLDDPVSGVAKLNVEATSTKTDAFKILTICELEVFGVGGRNLALRGNTNQSSTYTWDTGSTISSKAVDGDKSGNFTKGGCSCTNPGDPKPNLNLTFEDPVTINTFILYNRVDGDTSFILPRLQGFILRCFSRDNKELFTFTDTNPVAQPVYTVHPDKPVSGVSLVNVEATRTGLDGYKILTLCELEVIEE